MLQGPMFDFLSRWRPQHLLGAWAAYWVGLAGATLGGAVAAGWRVTHLPQGQGNISLSYDDGLVRLVMAGGDTAWTGTTSLGTLAFWLAVPPLLLWLVWILAQRRPASAVRAEVPAGGRTTGEPEPPGLLDRPVLGAAELAPHERELSALRRQPGVKLPRGGDPAA